MPFSRSGNVADAVELSPGNLLGIVRPNVVEPLSAVSTSKTTQESVLISPDNDDKISYR